MQTRTFNPEVFGRGLLAQAGNLVELGTRRYPAKTQRRLKAVNVGAFTIAVSCLCFALTYALEDMVIYRAPVIVNLVLAFAAASAPAFHRVSDIAASLFIAVALLAGLFVLVGLVGRDSGIQVNFVATSAAVFLTFELRRLRIIVAIIAAAIAFHIAAWVLFKQGVIPSDPRFLLQLYVTVVTTISVIVAVLVYYAFWTAEHAEAETEALLHRILPAPVAERLKTDPDAPISDSFASASVLFSDIVGFVPIARSLGAARTVAMLNDLVHRFDRLAEENGVEKIKTIGDAYMAAGGIPTPTPDHAARLARMALGMNEAAERTGTRYGVSLKLRIGIALGPVMAGVIGANRFGYDIWGDTVNLAARLEASSEPGRIHVSRAFCHALGDNFACAGRGETEIKGLGSEETWFLDRQA